VPGGPAEKAGLQQGDKVIPMCFAISRFLAAVRGREIGERFCPNSGLSMSSIERRFILDMLGKEWLAEERERKETEGWK